MCILSLLMRLMQNDKFLSWIIFFIKEKPLRLLFFFEPSDWNRYSARVDLKSPLQTYIKIADFYASIIKKIYR